ncbi:hypothetical protein AA313_de0204522 [Arthrobotrys entomopaga]|nr:hypothetical protein AA313_de0204522 [Arthrobotrys entomopaga]
MAIGLGLCYLLQTVASFWGQDSILCSGSNCQPRFPKTCFVYRRHGTKPMVPRAFRDRMFELLYDTQKGSRRRKRVAAGWLARKFENRLGNDAKALPSGLDKMPGQMSTVYASEKIPRDDA